MKIQKCSCSWWRFCSFLVIAFSLSFGSGLAHSGGVDIGDAKYKQEDDRFKVKGNTRDDAEVKLFDAHSGVLFATVNADDEGDWEYRKTHPAAIPCRVRAESTGESDEKNVEHANDFPGGCGIDGGGNTPPTANANGPYAGTTGVAVNFSSAGSMDPEGNIASYAWDFGDGGTSSAANPSHTYTMAGTFSVTLTVTDHDGETDSDTTTATITDDQIPPPTGPDISINSTSQNNFPGVVAVDEQAFAGNTNYKLFGTNDLGMHCGDFDTRISSILPPFNVVHAQVIQRGSDPKILGPDDGVSVVYSAASNSADPILTGFNSAGDPGVLSSVAGDGTVFKTNFWDAVSAGAYDLFYPFENPTIPGQQLTPLADPPFSVGVDVSLPMPNVERFYLGDGILTAEQQDMPGRFGPYVENIPQSFTLFTIDQPFFIDFPFGYTSPDVNWFEAAGVPLTAFDDFGRENPWPLYRFQAKDSNDTVLASTDVVLPISGEANCGACHLDQGNNVGPANQRLHDNGITVADELDDPEFINDSVPLEVAREYAADLNLVRLHDFKHNTDLENNTPVVCQSCHYTPALDLAQLGPLSGPAGTLANGRQQTNVKSMSNVMHSHHGTVHSDYTDPNSPLLFPDMPPAVDATGNLRDPVAAREVLMETCYQCHPGRRTDCLRGAMASGGMLCQDCHGDMAQVGDDFTRTVGEPGGGFELEDDFYTNSETPRVPWANEPGCGSCHTGDARNNMHANADTLGSPSDNIRLMQAYLIGDTRATPILPTNKRFAENTSGTGPQGNNPMLYRVSTGHEGVFCEACHGATHGIWPNGNPNANDNVAAMQLQGHTGTIAECSTCHTGDLGSNLGGPHGMHPIGSAGEKFAGGDHEELAKNNPNACRACHGQNGEGTVLSVMAQDRVLECDDSTAFCPNGNSVLFPNDHEVGCTECHDNEL